MTYYTIRAVTDGPGHYLPACRDEMRPVKKRNVHAHYTSSAELATDTRIGVKELIAQQDNGAAAWSINLARDQSYRAPADSGMRFYVVTGGVVTAAGETAAAFDCFFLSDADKFTELRAQGGDASLLVLQFDTVPSAS